MHIFTPHSTRAAATSRAKRQNVPHPQSLTLLAGLHLVPFGSFMTNLPVNQANLHKVFYGSLFYNTYRSNVYVARRNFIVFPLQFCSISVALGRLRCFQHVLI